MEVLSGKDRLPKAGVSGELVFSHLRCAKSAGIHNSDIAHSFSDDSIEQLHTILVFFSSKMSIRVRNELMKYLQEF